MVRGGYDVKTICAAPLNFICFFCHLLMRNTIQTCRGERACAECYKEKQKNVGIGICPIDREGDTSFFPDKYADKQIGEIDCYCPNEEFGCGESTKIKLLEDHLKNCKFQPSICSLCNKNVLDQEEHLKSNCIMRKVFCVYCGIQLVFNQLEDHLKTCAEHPPLCPYGCGDTLENRYLTPDHALNCPKILSKEQCVLCLIGCTGHECGQQHDVYLLCAMEKVKWESLALKSRVGELDVEKTNLLTQLLEKDIIINQLIQRLDQMEAKIESAKEQQSIINAKVTSTSEKLDRLDARVVTANTASSAADSRSITDCLTKVQHLDSNFTILSKNVADIDLKQQLLENTCYGPLFIWKVDNLEHRMNQAVIGRVTALHSAPCFTKKFGYKYCLRLYLNGDGLGKGSHISLFLVIMRSEYDTALEWPFHDRVVFKLRNYNDPTQSIKESFTPDPNSSSFKRPVREMNVAAGCPMFAPLDRLRQRNDFVRDNALFIEAHIG